MDYLPIQASAVPCERVFSSSSETDTKKRNRIKPELFEALQILKFGIKSDRLSFTADIITPEELMIGSHPAAKNRDLLAGYLNIWVDLMILICFALLSTFVRNHLLLLHLLPLHWLLFSLSVSLNRYFNYFNSNGVMIPCSVVPWRTYMFYVDWNLFTKLAPCPEIHILGACACIFPVSRSLPSRRALDQKK